MLTRLPMRSAAVALIVAALMSFGSQARAGPQDDPPVDVTPGSTFLPEGETALTLTLDSAGHAGDLEAGAIEAAKQAAAKAHAAESGSDSRTDDLVGADDRAVSADDNGTNEPDGECSWRDASALPLTDDAWGGNDPAAGTLLVRTCNGPESFLFVSNAAPSVPGVVPPPPPPPPNPAVLAQQAYTELAPPKPVAKRSPPEGNSDPQYGGLPYTWVGIWTYVWSGEWQPLSRTVGLRGVSATVTATPTALVFDPGDGSAPVTCEGPGRPWTEADGSAAPSAGACGHMYRAVTPNGPLTATTSIQWSVAWTSNVGAGGTFPALTTQTSSSFLVEQIQVVIVR